MSLLGVLDGSGMDTVGVEWFQSVCLLIRMCDKSSVGVECLQCVWHVLCGCGVSSVGYHEILNVGTL